MKSQFDLIGKKIKAIRKMTDMDMEAAGWDPDEVTTVPVLIELDNGVVIYAQTDEENNGAGVWVAVHEETENMAYMFDFIKETASL
jgi:hypothetical protein